MKAFMRDAVYFPSKAQRAEVWAVWALIAGMFISVKGREGSCTNLQIDVFNYILKYSIYYNKYSIQLSIHFTITLKLFSLSLFILSENIGFLQNLPSSAKALSRVTGLNWVRTLSALAPSKSVYSMRSWNGSSVNPSIQGGALLGPVWAWALLVEEPYNNEHNENG